MNITKREKNGVVYFTFPIFDQYDLVHGFSTKTGGVSEGEFASMNLSFNRNDERERVLENHRRFAEAVGYETEHLVLSDQIHETKVVKVTRDDCGKGIYRDSDLKGVDGLMTQDEKVALMTFYADCVPLFFYDPVQKVVASSHSGWRGTVAKMGAVTVRRMGEVYGCRPEDIIAVVGPSICQDCYEVSEDVVDEFAKCFPAEQMKELAIAKEDHKYQLDLWRANEWILREAGIKQEHLQVSGMCTCCHHDLLFSHRYTKGRRGNLAGVITLSPKSES